MGVAPSSGFGKPKVESGLDANASAANATLPLIMSRRQSWEFMTEKSSAVARSVKSSSHLAATRRLGRCFTTNMNAKRIITVLVCVTVIASYWSWHLHSKNSSNSAARLASSASERFIGDGGNATNRRSQDTVSPPLVTATVWEDQTVEKEISGDPAADTRRQMDEWQREGWLVTWFSGPIRKADGTTYRTWRVRRAKP